MKIICQDMVRLPGINKTVLITGGTSGLGLELVKILLRTGYNVIATGRQQLTLPGYPDRFELYRVDFADLHELAAVTRDICRDHSVDIVVCNAGVLSPPKPLLTADGLEYTFQVNFLSHLLMIEILLHRPEKPGNVRIAAVISPAYRLAGRRLELPSGLQKYSAVHSYSASKLYLSVLMALLPSKYGEKNITSFCFDPGIFRSGIWRTQNKLFARLYRIAAPFMKSPAVVAEALAERLTAGDIENGLIYDISKNSKKIPAIDQRQKEEFMRSSHSIIGPFCRNT
jgi:NAD(P)-dependent dehydrogenase (short-subunit alcohol dehydrogenase family)